jgi:2-polyprenyl-3-methyl-5-hydroxy-6-metoxy-1,4-benzoquinol methylase
MSFTKYDKRGAYHWRELARRTPTGYSARLHALYGWFLSQAHGRDGLVIDIGCGDGALTHLLSERTGGRVVGIEPEPSGVELATVTLAAAGSRAEVRRGRGEELPFEDSSASLVVMCEVVEHLASPKPLLREAARVLAPDGALLVSTPQWQSPELRPHHVHEFTAGELRDTCAEVFGTVEVQVAEPPHLYDAYLERPRARIAINLVCLAGLNPFRLRRPAVPRRKHWRQLLAIASEPRASTAGR